MSTHMNHADIAQLRLHHQQISASRAHNPAELVAAFGAMQAQDYRSSLWAIGARLPAWTEKQVEEAVAARTIVRTWPMRGTLHFVAAADVRWMLKLLTPRIIAGAANRARALELDETTFAQCRKLFSKALAGQRQVPRSSMLELLENVGISTTSQRGYHILCRLAQEGLLCFGSRLENEPTFTLLEEWVPASLDLEGESALAALALRYFSSHGPASLQDFVWWSGLKVGDARAGLAGISAQLTSVVVDGTQYWMGPDPAIPPQRTNHAYLLPAFDEYLLGYKERGAVLDSEHASVVVPGSNGVFLPILVTDGRVTGTWKKSGTSKKTALTASPIGKLKETDRRALERASQQYGKFLGQAVEFKS